MYAKTKVGKYLPKQKIRTETFTAAEWDLTGEIGWLPDKFKNFDPFTSGTGLVHDLFEHFEDEMEDIAGEIKAMGRSLYLRTNNYYMGYGMNINPAFMHIGSTIAELISPSRGDLGYNMRYGEEIRPCPYRVNLGYWSEEVEDDIKQIIAYAVKTAIAEQKSNGEPLSDLLISADDRRNIRLWLRYGFACALREYDAYAGRDTWEYLLHKTKEAIDKIRQPELGQTMSITLDKDRLKVFVEWGYAEDEYADDDTYDPEREVMVID